MSVVPVARMLVRLAREDDARILFDWANRPDSLAASLRTTVSIDWDTHAAWFARRVQNPDVVLLIAEHDGVPAGQARAERETTHAIVAIYVEPAHRLSGIAHHLLDVLRAEAVSRWPGVRLIACIRHDNPESVNLFERAGYRLVADKSDHTVHER